MKKRNLLSLLGAFLLVAMLLTSCSGTRDESSSSEESSIASEKIGVEQTPAEHEAHDYFVLEGNVEPISYGEISRLDGEIVDYDRENNLLALETKDLDVYNRVTKTVKVYDLSTGEVINEQSVTNELYEEVTEQTVLEVRIDYPVIRVIRTYHHGEDEADYEASYYFAKKNSEKIHTTNVLDYEMTAFENGLKAVLMGDKVVWIDKDMEIVRTVDAVIANGYELEWFDAEYEGYLYAWDESSLQIFNRSGMCCASYKAEKDAFISVYVLNDGDVLIQSFKMVDLYTPCDLKVGSMRYTVDSFVMRFTDGELKEISLDFLVDSLDTAYSEENSLPFALAEGRDNQALITRFANESMAVYQELVVLNNDLEIEYTLKNSTVGVQICTAEALNANYYTASVLTGGIERPYIFDLDGNVVSATVYSELNCSFIVTDTAIYDYSMNLVYDYAKNGFDFSSVDSASGNIFLFKFNFVTAATEGYLFNKDTETPVLLSDGVDSFPAYPEDVYGGSIGGLYMLRENEEITVYSANGEKHLTVSDTAPLDAYVFDGIVVLHTSFEGKPISYVLK